MTTVGGRYLLLRRSRASARFTAHDAIDTAIDRKVTVLIARAPVPTPVIDDPAPVVGVPTLLDTGVIERRDRGVRWLVTDPEVGRPVAAIRPGSFGPLEVLAVAHDVTRTVRALHDRCRSHGAIASDCVLIDANRAVQLTEANLATGGPRRADIQGLGAVLRHLLEPEPEKEWCELLQASPRFDLLSEIERLVRDLGSPRAFQRPYSITIVAARIDAIAHANALELRSPGSGRSDLESAERTLPPNDLVALLDMVGRRVPQLDRLAAWRRLSEGFGIGAPARTPSRGRAPHVDSTARAPRRRTTRFVAGAVATAIALGAAAWVGAVTDPRPTTARDSVVPDLSGLTPAAALHALSQRGLVAGGRRDEHSVEVPVGDVVRSIPSAGEASGRGAPVVLVVSTGPTPIATSDLIGVSLEAAKRRLAGSGAVLGDLELQPANAAFGTVISATESPTASRDARSFDLAITSGEQLVPDGLEGHDPASAASALTDAGFDVAVMPVETPDSPDGVVIGSQPSTGSLARPGSTVTLLVARLADPDDASPPTEPQPSPTSSPTR